MIEDMVKQLDLGKSTDKVLEEMEAGYDQDWKSMSSEVYKVIIDKVEGEAYDNINVMDAEEEELREAKGEEVIPEEWDGTKEVETLFMCIPLKSKKGTEVMEGLQELTK